MHPNRLLFFTILFLNQSASAQSPAELRMDSLRADYIRRYQDIAMDEMEHSGVPASIKLAQAILESRAGTSELAQQASNHFGIKCGKGWTGPSYAKFDDERDRQGRPRNSCFRKYASVVECYADHSTFIRNPEKAYRYGFLFELDPRDYKAWAEGLEKAGYSTVDYYAERLIYFIEHYRLYELDERAVNGRVALKRLAEINGVKMLQARQGETLLDMARLANLPSERLQAFNDGQYAPDQPLRQGDWVFIQPKAEQWSGAETFHQIEPGQGLFQVAQRYGIRLESLLALNGLKAGDQPAPYEFLRLRGQRAAGEQVVLYENPAPTTRISPQGVPATRVKTVAAPNGLVVEMLPEVRMESPAPAYNPVEPVASNQPSNNPLEVVIDTRTGQTQLYHTVQQGETLYSIARRYDRSADHIRKLNGISGKLLKTGQSLRIE